MNIESTFFQMHGTEKFKEELLNGKAILIRMKLRITVKFLNINSCRTYVLLSKYWLEIDKFGGYTDNESNYMIYLICKKYKH